MNYLKQALFCCFYTLFSLSAFSANAQSMSSFSPDISAIKDIIKSENIVALDKVIADGLDVNMRDGNGNTLLLYALQHNKNLKIVRKLISAGADVNAPAAEDGMTPMLWVVSTASRLQAEVMPVLKNLNNEEEEEDEEDDEDSSLDEKIEKEVIVRMSKAINLLKLLMENNADVSQETPFGTPLMKASTSEWNSEIIEILLKAGADVNQRDKNGRTALFYASAFDCNKVISQLLAAGADIENKDRDGLTYMEVSKKDFQK